MHAAGHIKRASVLFEDEKLTVAQFNLDGNSESASARAAAGAEAGTSRVLAVYESVRRFRPFRRAGRSPAGVAASSSVEKRGTCPRSAAATISPRPSGRERAVTNEPEDKRANEHGVSRN